MRMTIRAVAAVVLAVAMLAACSSEGDRFRIEGRFRNFNRGELYVYSPENPSRGRDTVTVADGRFSYEVMLAAPTTFLIIFPNYSQQVVFGRPGATAKVSADASHLREMKVSGTKDNELMTRFRQKVNDMTPLDARQAAIDFIREHPESPVSVYLVNRYLLLDPQPDYATAAELLRQIHAAVPSNGRIALMLHQVEELAVGAVDAVLPDFSAYDIDSCAVSRDSLRSKVNVITAWATWNRDSRNMQQELRKLSRTHQDSIAILGICLDVRKEDCRRQISRDTMDWHVVCDGQLWDSPLLRQLGLSTVPGLIIADGNGRIVARNLNASRMREQIEKMLKE